MPKTYNFSNPMYGRKWLRLLREDPVSGIRILPDLNLPSRNLGFSFRSNSLGLRGPSNVDAPNVVLGTSFAMGFAVDNGLNWYEQCLDDSGWFNLGLPVGMHQLNTLLETIYCGSAQNALVIYHPNFWQITQYFEQWRREGGSLFEIMGWETGWWRCLRLLARKRLREFRARKQGRIIRFRYADERYLVDAAYNRFDFDKSTDDTQNMLEMLRQLLARFRRVIILRVMLKQEFVPVQFQNELLRSTVENYERGWFLVQNTFKDDPRLSFHIPQGFSLADFHAIDTHWNAQGNRRFADSVRLALKGV